MVQCIVAKLWLGFLLLTWRMWFGRQRPPRCRYEQRTVTLHSRSDTSVTSVWVPTSERQTWHAHIESWTVANCEPPEVDSSSRRVPEIDDFFWVASFHVRAWHVCRPLSWKLDDRGKSPGNWAKCWRSGESCGISATGQGKHPAEVDSISDPFF